MPGFNSRWISPVTNRRITEYLSTLRILPEVGNRNSVSMSYLHNFFRKRSDNRDIPMYHNNPAIETSCNTLIDDHDQSPPRGKTSSGRDNIDDRDRPAVLQPKSFACNNLTMTDNPAGKTDSRSNGYRTAVTLIIVHYRRRGMRSRCSPPWDKFIPWRQRHPTDIKPAIGAYKPDQRR